jgi:hypothetical protein
MNSLKFKKPEAPLIFNRWSQRDIDRFSLAFVLILHIVATCIFFPPSQVLDPEPLYKSDYPVHTHRVHIYRSGLRESKLPWGYDPAVSGGRVMSPMDDVGAKPLQFLGILFPFIPAVTVVRLFLFFTLLSAPLWTLLSCRRLSISAGVQTWIMVVLISVIWFYVTRIYFLFGVNAFAFASVFAPYVLTLFLNFLQRPGLRIYMALCFGSGALFLLHIVSPVAILPSLVLNAFIARPLTWKWRLAVFAIPLVVLIMNSFWFLPFVLTYNMPSPPLTPLPPLDSISHLKFDSLSQMSYMIKPLWIIPRLVVLCIAIYGFVVMKKQVSNRLLITVALASVFCLFLKFFGSFIPIFARMQPIRFTIPAYVFLSFPIGFALSAIVQKFRLPVSLSAVGVSVILVVFAILTGKPERLPLPPNPNVFAEFITHETMPSDRLLIHSKDGYKYDGYEARVFPLAYGREVIGCSFPRLNDPIQFLRNRLLGKELASWSPDELQISLERWGVSWAFTQTDEARELFTELTGHTGTEVGEYHAFRIADSVSRFLIGKGSVNAEVNRLELSDVVPENGLVVLRYRYHPAWKTDAGIPVEQYPVPEDSRGFIALRNPPENLTLRFDPWAMLHESWPEQRPDILASTYQKHLLTIQ